MEKENPDLLASYNETHHSTAINYLIKKLMVEKVPLSNFIIVKAHEILMRGTSNENEILSGFRQNNGIFVGYYDNGKKNILYFPISYDEIEKAMLLFHSFYNSPVKSEEEVFIRPFLSHGLLAALQVFEDGNTRLARTIQHIKLFELTKAYIDKDLFLPAIYFSKAYMPYRQQYRDLISQIALDPNHENWNNWIKFNLNRIQDQLYLNTEQLKRTRRI